MVPGYVVGERLGQGGFGEVFRARQELIDREVAIKVLHAKYAEDGEAVARFIAEGRALAKLQHPGIVQLYDFDRLADGRPYCVMELLHGTTLREVLRANGALPLAEALPLLRGIAEAVDAAHAVGIAHRDLKPENVFVRDTGGVVLIDFGLAKLSGTAAPITETGAVFGTPLYMSPEQCRGKEAGPPADAYAFGALAYHVLTGAPPFSGEPLAIALAHLNDRPAPPGLAPEVDRTLLALLEKDPARRPLPLTTAVDALAGTRRAPRRLPLALVAGATVLAGGGALALLLGLRGGTEEPRLAMQPLAVKLEGPLEPPIQLLDGGATLAFGDHSGVWTFDIATGKVAALPDAPRSFSTAPDGTTYATFGRFASSSVGLYDLAARKRTATLFPGAWPSVSPDGTRLVYFADGHAIVRDLQTGTNRKLAAIAASPYGGVDVARPPSWLPDGNSVLFSYATFQPGGMLQRLDLATGALTTLDVEVLVDMDNVTPFALAGGDRLVYCAPDRTIRLRGLEPGAPTSTLGPAPPIASVCAFAPFEHGRSVMFTMNARPLLGSVDLGVSPPALKVSKGLEVWAVADRAPTGETYVLENKGTFDRSQPRVNPVLALRADGTATPVPACGHDIGVVVDRGELRRVTLEGTTLTLRDRASCAAIVTWTLPRVGDRVSFLRCAGERCAFATLDGQQLRVDVLGRNGSVRELVAANEQSRGFPSVALDPDGRRLVACDGSAVIRLYDLETGATTPIDLGESISVAWGKDPASFYAIVRERPGRPAGILRVGIDGTRNYVFTSATWLCRLWADRTTDELLVTARVLDQDAFLLTLD